MFAYSHEMDSKYFNGYGVKLKAHDNSKVSYCNAILQMLINLDRQFSYDLFMQVYSYEGDDMVVIALKKVLNKIADIFEANRGRMENLVQSDMSLGKTPPENKGSIHEFANPAEIPVDTEELVKVCQVEFKDSLNLKNKSNNE